MKLLFCGDIMPGGVLHYQTDTVSNEMQDYLSNFDYRIGTLECAIGQDLPFDKDKMDYEFGKNIVYACDSDINLLNRLKIDIVSLANNHFYDLSHQGLVNTITLLDKNGIKHCGAGLNLQEASKPVVLIKDGLSLAIIGCCIKGCPPWFVTPATKSTSGIYQPNISELCLYIQQLKCKYDKVVIMPHWCKEYNYLPIPQCIDYAKQIVSAGADAIMGSHTHSIHPFVSIEGVPVAFSMGNFVFPDIQVAPPRPMFYPSDKSVINDLPRITCYPNTVRQKSLAVWPYKSRIGLMVELMTDREEIRHSYRLSRLSRDNKLLLYKGKKEIIRLRLLNLITLSNYYALIYKISLIPGNFKKIFMRILTEIILIKRKLTDANR